MSAFRRNRTLLESNVTGDRLNALDHSRLLTYHQRNRDLCSMIVSEDEMSHSGFLLPSLLHLLKDIGAGLSWTLLLVWMTGLGHVPR
jgi:hypothetical protein